jgi:protein-disulfide isomerase
MPPVFSMAPPVLWLVRTIALIALGTSGWLTLQKWLNPRISLAGCGGSEGCATLLDSRWSSWFSVPVTLMAATLWLAVTLLTLPSASRWLGRTADQLLAACAVLLIAGAVWFGALMLVVVKVWCPWCAGLHAAAIVVGIALLHSTWRASRQGEAGLFCVAGQVGVAGVALLVLGQFFGTPPDTHLLTTAPAAPAGSSAAAGTAPPADSLSFMEGSLVLPLRDHPSFGSPEAPHVLASFSDYTCSACRAQYSDLLALLKSAPGRYAVLVLPTPLDSACNPHVTSAVDAAPNGSCALAALALAFWKANPAEFPAFHDFLMTAPLPLDQATAETAARRLSTKPLEKAAPWITSRLQDNIVAWHQLSAETSKLPKLLLRDDIVLHGSTSSRERFFEIVTETFSPPADLAIPVSTLPR